MCFNNVIYFSVKIKTENIKILKICKNTVKFVEKYLYRHKISLPSNKEGMFCLTNFELGVSSIL